MKRYLITAMAFGLLVGSVSAADKPDLKDTKKRSSYAIGLDIGSSFKDNDLDLDIPSLAAGIADAFSGTPLLNEDEMKETLMAFQRAMQAKVAAKQSELRDKNLKAGEDFLAANGKKDGVKTTASGLQYKVMKSGAGRTPKATDKVRTHYHGTLIDGTVFDSSVQRGEPVEFPVNGVIPGWTEALKMMKEGDKWQLFIPSKLAYGEQGTPGGPIGPNSALVFEVELLSIVN